MIFRFEFGGVPLDTCPKCHRSYDDHDLTGEKPACPPVLPEIEFFSW